MVVAPRMPASVRSWATPACTPRRSTGVTSQRWSGRCATVIETCPTVTQTRAPRPHGAACARPLADFQATPHSGGLLSAHMNAIQPTAGGPGEGFSTTNRRNRLGLPCERYQPGLTRAHSRMGSAVCAHHFGQPVLRIVTLPSTGTFVLLWTFDNAARAGRSMTPPSFSGRLELTCTNNYLRLLAYEDGWDEWMSPTDHRPLAIAADQLARVARRVSHRVCRYSLLQQAGALWRTHAHRR
jgi:hypothetical protein